MRRTGRAVLCCCPVALRGVDVPRPFARAPRERFEPLLAAYNATVIEPTADPAVTGAAETTRAPSRLLITAAAAAGSQPGRRRGRDGRRRMPCRSSPLRRPRDLPGPVESTLPDLGVSRREFLQRGERRAPTRQAHS